MNPPQPAFQFEQNITTAVIWLGSNKEWFLSKKGEPSIFDTGNAKHEKSGSLLKNLDKNAFGDILFVVVRESLNKEKSKKLLGLLSQFSLKKVYLASPFDDTLSALEGLEPRFWYAASPRSWVKWSLFETFGIEKAFTLDSDFVFVDKETSKLMSPRLTKEIQRRRLPMITVKKNGSLKFN